MKASPEEMHLYSEEAEADLIAASLKLAEEDIAEEQAIMSPRHHEEIVETYMEQHRERVAKIELLFFQKRSGQPF